MDAERGKNQFIERMFKLIEWKKLVLQSEVDGAKVDNRAGVGAIVTVAYVLGAKLGVGAFIVGGIDRITIGLVYEQFTGFRIFVCSVCKPYRYIGIVDQISR